MKKILITTIVVVALVALMTGSAMADEWWKMDGMAVDFSNLAAAKQAVLTTAGLTFATDTVGVAFVSDVNSARSGFAARSDGWGTFDVNTIGIGQPHGGYSTTTNYCKTCHAVHDAGTDSYRLLKNGDTTFELQLGEGSATTVPDISGMGSERDNECMYCHNAKSGATSYRPYALGMITTIRGEHTIGATYIPDSRISTDVAGIDPVADRQLNDGRSAMLSNRDPANRDAATGGILGCYDCHSVHGANTLAVWAGDKLLRLDPANDGTNVTDDGRLGYASSGDIGNYNGVTVTLGDMARNNFCADCHNKNSSWDTDDSRPNPAGGASHVTGPSADGQAEVYGTTTTVAAGSESGITDRGCRGCHNSSDHGTNLFAETTDTVSAWPHQSIESKFLRDNTTTAAPDPDDHDGYNGEVSGYDRNGKAGDSYRELTLLDSICLRCHSENGDGTGTWGVGISF